MSYSKAELNTNLLPIFSGTYCSLWEVVEYNDNGDELETEYTQESLMGSIVEAYQSQEINMSRDITQVIPWVKSITFPGGSYSPREYNFSTDTLDFILEYNHREAIKAARDLANVPEFRAFLIEHYRSRDGFWSYTPDNPTDLIDQLTRKGDEYEQALAALVRYLLQDELEELEEIAREFWQGNGYMSLNYKISKKE